MSLPLYLLACRFPLEETMNRWAQICLQHEQDSTETIFFSFDRTWQNTEAKSQCEKETGWKGQNLAVERGRARLSPDWMVRFRGAEHVPWSSFFLKGVL